MDRYLKPGSIWMTLQKKCAWLALVGASRLDLCEGTYGENWQPTPKHDVAGVTQMELCGWIGKFLILRHIHIPVISFCQGNFLMMKMMMKIKQSAKLTYLLNDLGLNMAQRVRVCVQFRAWTVICSTTCCNPVQFQAHPNLLHLCSTRLTTLLLTDRTPPRLKVFGVFFCKLDIQAAEM